jgi:hypothetical protein
MTTLVVDTGQNLVGVFSAEEQLYVPYRGVEILIALQRIAEADEVVTYNGKNYDLKELGRFAGLNGDLPLRGIHSDMRSICWSDRWQAWKAGKLTILDGGRRAETATDPPSDKLNLCLEMNRRRITSFSKNTWKPSAIPA